MPRSSAPRKPAARKPAAARTRRTSTAGRKAAVKDDLTKLVDLTPEEVQRLPKARDGFEKHAEELLAFYETHREVLGGGPIDTDGARARLGAWQSLAPIESSARKHLEMVEETRMLHSSKVWTAMLEIYARGQTAGRTDPEIRRAISDFAEFMKLGPRPKKPE